MNKNKQQYYQSFFNSDNKENKYPSGLDEDDAKNKSKDKLNKIASEITSEILPIIGTKMNINEVLKDKDRTYVMKEICNIIQRRIETF